LLVLGLAGFDLAELQISSQTAKAHPWRCKAFDGACAVCIYSGRRQAPPLTGVGTELKINGCWCSPNRVAVADMITPIVPLLQHIGSVHVLPGDVVITGTRQRCWRVERGDDLDSWAIPGGRAAR